MYTVLLVDDETTMLDTLVQRIHWQQYGVDTVLTASDGLQAIDVLSRQTVDLLITDVKMPHMDGLSLLETVRISYPDTHCIILTAYDEFSYAQQAIQLGVENYLLKPLDTNEMEESIEQALDNIYASRKMSRRLFRNNIYTRWVKRTISTNELAERANLLQINLYLPEYCVVIISKKQPSLSLSSYCTSCLESLSVNYDIHHFKDDLGRHVFILGGAEINAGHIIQILTSEANQISISHLITLSVGNIVSGADHVPDSYRVAHNLIENGTEDESQISSPGNLTVLKTNTQIEQFESSLTLQLTQLFQLQEDEPPVDKFLEITESLVDLTKSLSLSSVQILLNHSLLQVFAQEFPNHPDAQEQLKSRIRTTLSITDGDSFHADLLELLEFSNLLYRYYVNKLHPLVQSAIRYIHAHYPESISIPEFCLQAKVSSPYLGYLFKKETGYFFNNYLTQHRIYCSIPLLLDSNMKISDIAQHVGFASASYYITRFKQQMGISPIKYRMRTS